MITRPLEQQATIWNYAGVAAGVLAGLLLAGTLTTIVLREDTYRVQQINQVKVQAQIFGATVSAALAFDAHAEAQEYVNAMSRAPQLKAAAAYDETGARIASFARSPSTDLPARAQTPSTNVVADDVIVTLAVQEGGTHVGFIALRGALEDAGRQRARLLIIGALTLLTGLVVLVLTVGQISLRRANRTLASQARQLSDTVGRLHTEMGEREKAEHALRQSQKMEAIGQLAGGIAHDFNNLLSIIKGNLQLLKRRLDQGKTDSLDRYLGATDEAINRAANLTQRVLAYSRRQPLSPTDVDPATLVRGMADLFKHSVSERVAIEFHLESDWTVVCDANQMENVLLNLANNAGDAMPDSGRFTISTRNRHIENMSPEFEDLPPGDYVEVKVRDTGVGMDEETRKKATDPFFTTKPLGRGTGLGLSTAFGYIRQSHGHMVIESKRGEGTTITILMPRRSKERNTK